MNLKVDYSDELCGSCHGTTEDRCNELEYVEKSTQSETEVRKGTLNRKFIPAQCEKHVYSNAFHHLQFTAFLNREFCVRIERPKTVLCMLIIKYIYTDLRLLAYLTEKNKKSQIVILFYRPT